MVERVEQIARAIEGGRGADMMGLYQTLLVINPHRHDNVARVGATWCDAHLVVENHVVGAAVKREFADDDIPIVPLSSLPEYTLGRDRDFTLAVDNSVVIAALAELARTRSLIATLLGGLCQQAEACRQHEGEEAWDEIAQLTQALVEKLEQRLRSV